MIKHTSFKHGWWYHYRVHMEKLEESDPLSHYLQDIFTNCPDECFLKGPRSSSLKFDVPVNLIEIPGHEVCGWALHGLELDMYGTAHSNVQMFMLQNDPKTVAVEVPIWMHDHEMDGFKDKFEKGPLSGHIDLLRLEDGRIWVWDYKPNASKEKYAHTQVYFYAKMLSQRAGVPLDKFMCGYFDDKTSFVFDPTVVK